MNAAHIHLMVNHLPLIGLLLGLILVFVSLFVASDVLKKVSLLVVFCTALTAVPAYLTGEDAEDVVENNPQVQEALIEDHEESAELSLVLMLLTGATSGIAWFLGRGSPRRLQLGSYASLVVGALAFVSVSLTANSGGKISHPEIRSDFTQPGNKPIALGTSKQEKSSEADAGRDDDDHDDEDD